MDLETDEGLSEDTKSKLSIEGDSDGDSEDSDDVLSIDTSSKLGVEPDSEDVVSIDTCVSSTEQSTCLLTDVCCDRNFMFVVDSENRKMKRFARNSNKFVESLDLDDPCGLCKLFLSSHVIVTEPSKRHLTYVSVDEELTISNRRKTKKKYGAIRCLSETRIVVGCCELSNASVDILDYTGKILQSINNNNEDVPFCMTPAYLTCHREEHIIVSDSGTKKVTCLTKLGEIEWTICFKCSPSGVCVTPSGTLYICLFDENRIIIVDDIRHGKITGSMGDLPLKSPLSVCHSFGYLFVTEEMPSNRVLRIQTDDPVDKGKVVALSNIHLIIENDCDVGTIDVDEIASSNDDEY